MNWVYPLLSGVTAANIVLLLYRYFCGISRRIQLYVAAYLFFDLGVTLILSGTTGPNPQLDFAVWRPIVVFCRQMLVLAGLWMLYVFRGEAPGRY